MITDALLRFASGLLSFLFGLVPDVGPPAWLTDALSGIGGLFSNLGLLSHWFPVGLLGPAVALVLLAMVSGFAVKAGRAVLSVFTGGGGSSG